MVILIILGMIILGFGGYYFLKGIWLLCKAGYYKWLASEEVLDEAMKKEIYSKDSEYKKFEKDFDKNLDSLLNN